MSVGEWIAVIFGSITILGLVTWMAINANKNWDIPDQ